MAEMKTIPINDWLRNVGDLEAEHDITVGTRDDNRLSHLGHRGSLGLIALGKLIELKRRETGLTIDRLAESAHVTVCEVMNLERGLGEGVDSAVLQSVASALHLPPQKLATMLGSRAPEARPIQEAAVRFAARTSGMDELKQVERDALSEFVEALEVSR